MFHQIIMAEKIRRKRKARARALARSALIASDGLCITAGFMIANMITVSGGGYWTTAWIATLLIYWGSAFNARAYSVQVVAGKRQSLILVAQAWLLTAAILACAVFLTKAGADFSRTRIITVIIVTFIALVTSRRIYNIHLAKRVRPHIYHALMIVDDVPMPLHPEFAKARRAAGLINITKRSPETMDRLARLTEFADRVVIACAPSKKNDWAFALQGLNIRAEILAPELANPLPIALDTFNGRPTLVFSEGNMVFSDVVMKRAFDIVFAVCALIFLSPLMLFIAYWIKVDSRGPVFFRQVRIGIGNRQFRIWKFRTMAWNHADHNGNLSTSHNDERITYFGHILRCWSLDELPQLFNVLTGEMSIVGPRPHALGSSVGKRLFWEIDQHYWHRHAIKPGLTGLAQIRGFRGTTRQQYDLEARLGADMEYIAHWSLFSDLAIIAKTLGVISHDNAY